MLCCFLVVVVWWKSSCCPLLSDVVWPELMVLTTASYCPLVAPLLCTSSTLCFRSDHRADLPSLCRRWKQLFDSERRRRFNKQIKQTFGTQGTFCLAASQEEREKKMRRAAGKVSQRFLDVITSFWCLMGKELICNIKTGRVGSTSGKTTTPTVGAGQGPRRR